MAIEAQKQAAEKLAKKQKPKASKKAGRTKGKRKVKRVSAAKKSQVLKRSLFAVAVIAACTLLIIAAIRMNITKQKLEKAMTMLGYCDYDAAYGLLEELGRTDIIAQSKLERSFNIVNDGDYKTGFALLEGIRNIDSYQKFADIKDAYYRDFLPKAEVGDVIHFGSYEQDNNASNGKELVDWLVLAKNSDNILAISQYALDVKPFNESWKEVTWDNCSLRQWLNNQFYNIAFSALEQEKIRESEVTADKNPLFDTPPGNNTIDKVFLLSIPEAEKYFSSAEARKCLPTPYAVGCDILKNNQTGYCCYWLRSPGNTALFGSLVDDGGEMTGHGTYVYDFYVTVRPVIRINI